MVVQGDASGRDRVIVALDTATLAEAVSMADALAGAVRHVKVGMTLFYAEGPAAVQTLRARGFDVFVDLKLHDIPHQVAGAARSLARLGARMVTVHAGGGPAMVRAAVEASREEADRLGIAPPAVLAVTVLTSIDEATLSAVGVGGDVASQVERLASMALREGAAGVVCSPQEATAVRSVLGADALVVTPGVRPVAMTGDDDQARVATPADAVRAGASHIVVGRPITGAADPVAAARRVIEEVDEA